MLESFASAFAGVFGSLYDDGLLHVPTRTEGDGGDVTVAFTGDAGQPAATAIKGQVDQVSEAMRLQAGYTEREQRLFVLQDGVDALTSDYEITLGGTRWKIAAVESDPLNTHWVVRGMRA